MLNFKREDRVKIYQLKADIDNMKQAMVSLLSQVVQNDDTHEVLHICDRIKYFIKLNEASICSILYKYL